MASVITAAPHGSAQNDALGPMLRKLDYWVKLEHDDRAALLALPHQVRRMDNHEYVVRDLDKATHSCMILSGFAMRHKLIGDGLRQIVSIHFRGDFVDLHNSLLGSADHNVQMMTTGRALFIPREAIERIAFERPRIGRAMWIDTIVDASIHREWVANIGRRDARERIAHLLCEIALRFEVAGLGGRSSFDLPMTQEEIADATGLTPVHVNRTIRALEGEGLIDRLTPRSISIGDWDRLAAVGDFSSDYLHLKDSAAPIQ
jgi:CRP-like cAMP-binding protein